MWATEELQEPTQLQAVRAHKNEVTCVDASGAWLVSGSGDRSLRLWRWESGRGWDEVARAGDAHRYGVTAARWAASGALLASGGVDGAARVWCGRSLAARRVLAAPGATATRALAWAARARLLAGHDDGALCVWHVPRAQLLARLHAHDGALHAVAAPARGALLLTACTHGVLKVFDLAEVCRIGTGGAVTPAPLAWMDNVHDLGATCADVTDDGRLAATGGQDSIIHVWRTKLDGLRACGLHKCGHGLRGHTAAVTALRFGAGGASIVLASASLDRTARLWVPDGESLTCAHVVHAHSRYLTCVALAYNLRYMVTGSNDKSFRMWSLGSLTLDDTLDVPCAVLTHFALGDLDGITAVSDDLDDEPIAEGGSMLAKVGHSEQAEGSGAHRLWQSVAHAGAINDIVTHGSLVATASSDGIARVFRWSDEAGVLDGVHALDAHQYPVTSVELCAAGALLLTAGLDARACLWDVETGVVVRSLSVPAGGASGAGGGGVRCARASPPRAALLLLATDDGDAPLWSLDDNSPEPLHVFPGHLEALTCCAWSCDGRVLACGDSAGELRVYEPPPRARLLHHQMHAHDRGGDAGVQCCEFAPAPLAEELPEQTYLLASGGGDAYIRMWVIEYRPEEETLRCVTVRPVAGVAAHGGGVSHLRWGGALLASAGGDACVRVWRVLGAGSVVTLLLAVPMDGVLSVALLAEAEPPRLVCGALSGELSVWQLPPEPDDDDEPATDEEGTAPCFWNREGVSRWIRECITRVPGSERSRTEEDCLIQKCVDLDLTGSKLISTPVESILDMLGYAPLELDAVHGDDKAPMELTTLRKELGWLQRTLVPYARERSAPHLLLCPLTHRLLREPAMAADGYTYERGNILDWFIAADGPVSPLTGRRLRNSRVFLNYSLRDQLREFLSH